VARADLLRAIHSWATRHGLMLVLSGIDLNPRVVIVGDGLVEAAAHKICGEFVSIAQPRPAPRPASAHASAR
jgi:hypothetical protein